MPQGVQGKVRLPIRNSKNSGDRLNCHRFLRFDRIARNMRRVRARPKQCVGSGAVPEEQPGESIMPSTPRSIISSKDALTDVGAAAAKTVAVVVTRKPRRS